MKNDTIVASNASPGVALVLEVNITDGLASVDVMDHGRKVTILRNQNQSNRINPDFALTSRKYPPFCIQPSDLAPGVKTIAELEVIDFLKIISAGDTSMMVIDSRTKAWVEKGIIPGTVNIPWDTFEIGESDATAVQKILENQLGAKRQDDFWNFDKVKTLVLFCNGPDPRPHLRDDRGHSNRSPRRTRWKDGLLFSDPCRKKFLSTPVGA